MEDTVLWGFPIMRGKNIVIMVNIYLNETKHIKLGISMTKILSLFTFRSLNTVRDT